MNYVMQASILFKSGLVNVSRITNTLTLPTFTTWAYTHKYYRYNPLEINKVHSIINFAKEGNLISPLSCTSTTPAIWTHNWKALPQNVVNENNIIRLGRISHYLQGSYECAGTNEHGEKFLGVAFVFLTGMP